MAVQKLHACRAFPERLSVGLITAVYQSGDKSDMSNYRGITVGSVIAKLFAMVLEQRTVPGMVHSMTSIVLQKALSCLWSLPHFWLQRRIG